MTGGWITDAANTYLAIGHMLDTGEAKPEEVPVILLHNLYLISCLAYYETDSPFISDSTFDAICRDLAARPEPAGVWWAKETWVPDNFRAGTGFDLKYPHGIRLIGREIGYLLAMKAYNETGHIP